jgi:hypothetical protein
MMPVHPKEEPVAVDVGEPVGVKLFITLSWLETRELVKDVMEEARFKVEEGWLELIVDV